MKLASSVPTLDAATLHRLLRRQTLEPVLFGLKIAFGVLSFALLVLIIMRSVNSYLSISNGAAELSQQVEKAKLRVQQHDTHATLPDLTVIEKKNIFGPLTGPTLAKPETELAKTAPKTPMTLIGSFITSNEPPYAIIQEDKKKEQEVFGIGDMVFDEAKLVTIEADRVVLNRNGEQEILTLDENKEGGGEYKDGIAALDGNHYMVQESELDQALQNLPQLLTEARAVPYFRDGHAMGLRLFALKSGSLYEKLGLQNGDILKSINGSPLSDLSQAMQLFERLKSDRSIGLTLERNSVDQDFKYEIK